MQRRDFLAGAGISAGAALRLGVGKPALAATPGKDAAVAAKPAPGTPAAGGSASSPEGFSDWAAVRAEFPTLVRDRVHMALMLLTSHPRPVRDAIERHRRGLDENPVEYFEARFSHAENDVRTAAARYMGGDANHVALTDSTTMGLAVLYGGLRLRPGDEVLTTTHDHYSTHENLRLTALRAGRTKATVKKVALYEQASAATEESVTAKLLTAIGPRTRAVAVTWVHSSTGVKLPIKRIAAEIATLNRKRSEADRVLLCVDGVHAFGVEAESPAELGCDFFAAGCHKWLFGPRGTGVLWGRAEAWKANVSLIAAFEKDPYVAWMKGQIPGGPPGPMATPGGFHSFEHRWALTEAFAFHQRLGRARVAARIHELARQCKEGLRAMPHITLHTPIADALSAGIICFEVRGMKAPDVIKRLHARKIIASVTPYATEYARLSPGLCNTPEEVDLVLREVRALT
ncbi:MAG TPA: aminotransferase class V-fold PLP-dependent enzyme [Polyangia bacterium]